MHCNRNTWLFLLLCLIWGTTWIGIKAGVDAVPPLFFAGTRFTAAGAILLVIVVWRNPTVFARSDLTRVVLSSLFMITLCYGPLFWAMRFLDSGTTAVLELALTPIALMVFAVALKEERFTWSKTIAIAVGVIGLAVLFGRSAAQGWADQNTSATTQIYGVIAITTAAFSYGLGSAVARPLLRVYPAGLVAGATTLIGGVALLTLSFSFEPNAMEALSGDWGVAAWSGWLFLVVFGSLIGYSVYMRLLRDIGASRAGMYSFVSPVIAVLLGVTILGETLNAIDAVGMTIMLGAAWLAMHPGVEAVPRSKSAEGSVLDR